MVKTKTEQVIIDALEAVAPQHDVDIVDVELVGATKAPCVRVRIEGAEGQSLSLNDVTANTKWVGDVIEELDPISSSYTLEVSSPAWRARCVARATLPALWAKTASFPPLPQRAVASTPARLPPRPRRT